MKRNKSNNSDTVRTQKNASKSLIVTLLDKLSDSVYNALKNGFLGKIFTSYSKVEESFESGYLKQHFTGYSKFRHYFRNVRKYLSGAFESSLLLNKISSAASELVAMPLKNYGNFFFAFGLYVIIEAFFYIPFLG